LVTSQRNKPVLFLRIDIYKPFNNIAVRIAFMRNPPIVSSRSAAS